MHGEMEQRLLTAVEEGISLGEKLQVDDVEVYASAHRGSSVSMEKDSFSRSSGSLEMGAAVRVIREGRVSFAHTSDLDNIGTALEAALAMARFGLKYPTSFAGEIKSAPTGDLYDRRIRDLEMAEATSMASDIISGVKDLDERLMLSSGGLGWGEDTTAIANSSGAHGSYSTTSITAFMTLLIKEGERVATGTETLSRRALDFLPFDLLEKASQTVLSSLDPIPLEGPGGTVVVVPDAMEGLMESTVSPAFLGDNAMKGNSPLSRKEGEQVMWQGLDIVERGDLPGSINSSPFDDEGTVSKTVELVKGGVLKGFLFDRAAGEEYGKGSTGNGIRAETYLTGAAHQNPPRPVVRNLELCSGEAVNDVVSEVDRGILVKQLLGAHTANLASGDFSVNSTTLFRIDKGEVGPALKPIMISGNIFDAFSEEMIVGKEHKETYGSLSRCGMRLPVLGMTGLNIIS